MAAQHPYAGASPRRMWRKAVAEREPGEVDPAEGFGFRVRRDHKVVSAGSCFAEHIARRLRQSGFDYLITEHAHAILPATVGEAFHYGLYSARWGPIYTTRQLLQLFQRAYGVFAPREAVWERDGRYFDPFRPQIQPGGFASRLEFDLDQRHHLASVRAAFEQMDVFIFTLGLTECWVSREDGAAFSVCPGTVAGEFDPARHAFVNFSVEQVLADLEAFLDALGEINPNARTVLTVSPVPLAATAEERHVVVSTTLSKAVLRVAADLAARRDKVFYFPSFEIITSSATGGRYFALDRRQVTEAGVDRVMASFFRNAAEETGPALAAPSAPPADDGFLERSKAAVAALCDEDRLDSVWSAAGS